MDVLIVGASGGIGSAILKTLLANPSAITAEPVDRIWATHLHSPQALRHPQVTWLKLDAADEASVRATAEQIPTLRALINCVGFLHSDTLQPEKTIKAFRPETLLANMQLNTLPTLLLAKHFQQHFARQKESVFATISAKVGSINDNRLGGWYSYRTSKAAVNMALKCLALEWQHSLPFMRVAALHPGTTNTPLSGPFQHNVPPEKLFSPQRSAQQLLDVIQQLKNHPSGGFWSWDGTQLPW